MSSPENLHDRLTLSPNRVGSVFLGDIQRHRLLGTTPSSRLSSSPQSTPASSPPNTASLSGIFALHHSHGRRSTTSSLDDDTGIDMDPPAPMLAASSESNAPPRHSDGPGKVDPVLALELRLRWLEALVLGIKQELSREKKGKGRDHAAEYAGFGNAQTIALANLKRGETLVRLAESVQQKLDKALEGNEGLRRFMDNCLFSLLSFFILFFSYVFSR
jgi:hypothetical protein